MLECARRALSSGALATAEHTARQARQLASDGSLEAFDADELLVHVLTEAGKLQLALALGRSLEQSVPTTGVSGSRRADLHVALARAAVTARDHAAASAAASAARAAAGPDAALVARIDVVSAAVALDEADLDRAEQLASAAVAGAEATEQPEVLCEALLVLGRASLPRGLSGAKEHFRRAAHEADRAGLARWRLRAQQELALELLTTESPRELMETRDLAARYGAHLTVASMDLALADLGLVTFDADGCRRSATACIDASRRYGLPSGPVAHLWLAGAHALAGDDAAMTAAIDGALEHDPDDPRIHADLYGRVLATRAFVRDELDTLPELLEQMIVFVRDAPPTTSVYPGRVAWALVHTIDGDDLGEAARAEYHAAAEQMQIPMFSQLGQMIDAAAIGRAGDPERATSIMAEVYPELVANPIARGMARTHVLLLARGAIRDGWGDPVRWLRDSEAWFAERGFDRLVRRSRALLGETGAPVPRRGRGDSEVPVSLRALGVTSREVDVLKLVIDGCSTKQIAERLFLSPKTVERHLTSLFRRLGVSNRAELAELGAPHLV